VLAGWWRSWLVFVLAGVRTGGVRSWRSYWRCSWLAFVLAAFVAGGRAGWRRLAFGVWRSWLAFVLAAFVAGFRAGWRSYWRRRSGGVRAGVVLVYRAVGAHT
jgi:hypothetical protein